MAFRTRAVAGGFLLAACLAFSAHATDLVTLRNGFTLSCASREAISPEVIRLHLDVVGSGDQNYMDVPLASIDRIEALAEPVAPSVATQAQVQTKPNDLDSIARRSGETHNLNVALLMAVIHAESAGNAHAVSRAGARGLMQLMPATAAHLGVADSFAPQSNVNGGSAYLDQLLTRYHDNIALALAAYNAGPTAVDRYRGIPPFRETRMYVAKVIRLWNNAVAAQTAPSVSNPVANR